MFDSLGHVNSTPLVFWKVEYPRAKCSAKKSDGCGSISLPFRSTASQQLGIKEVDEGIWLASFMHYDLGYFDLEQKTLQPRDNPSGTRLSPMSPGLTGEFWRATTDDDEHYVYARAL